MVLSIGHAMPANSSASSLWSLEIFRISGRDRQQRTLEAFDRLRLPGVHALGVIRGDEFFVIIDSDSLPAEVRARRIVIRMDPAAARVQSTRSRSGRPGARNFRNSSDFGS